MRFCTVARNKTSKDIQARPAALPIALVFGHERGYCSDVLRGIGRYARGCGNWALVSLFPHRRLAEALDSLKPAGIVVDAICTGTNNILRKTGRPVVNVNPGLADSHFSHVLLDEVSIGIVAAEHLLECGLRNFGYFGPPWSGPACNREGGFHQTLQRLSHTVSVCYVRPPGGNPRGGTFASRKHICQWVRNLPKPIGVFAPNDTWALWLCGVCKQEGIKVPDEIAVIGAGNDELLCELSQPTLSSVAIPAERVGYEAAALLDRLIGREPAPDKQILLPAVGVVTRQSTDCLAVSDSDLRTAINYMREHISEPMAVEEVLQHVFMSRRSFEQKFRAALGRSPAQEIRRMRIAMAKSFLTANPSMKTENIARCCGFSSKAQFITVFRQATGMTSTDYRRSMERANNQLHSPASSSINSLVTKSNLQR
jgi:LacI family transcriptional regulator